MHRQGGVGRDELRLRRGHRHDESRLTGRDRHCCLTAGDLEPDADHRGVEPDGAGKVGDCDELAVGQRSGGGASRLPLPGPHGPLRRGIEVPVGLMAEMAELPQGVLDLCDVVTAGARLEVAVERHLARHSAHGDEIHRVQQVSDVDRPRLADRGDGACQGVDRDRCEALGHRRDEGEGAAHLLSADGHDWCARLLHGVDRRRADGDAPRPERGGEEHEAQQDQ